MSTLVIQYVNLSVSQLLFIHCYTFYSTYRVSQQSSPCSYSCNSFCNSLLFHFIFYSCLLCLLLLFKLMSLHTHQSCCACVCVSVCVVCVSVCVILHMHNTCKGRRLATAAAAAAAVSSVPSVYLPTMQRYLRLYPYRLPTTLLPPFSTESHIIFNSFQPCSLRRRRRRRRFICHLFTLRTGSLAYPAAYPYPPSHTIMANPQIKQ